MGAPAAQPLPAPWLGWEKPALRGIQDSGSHRCAVFQRGKTVLWKFKVNVLNSCDREGKRDLENWEQRETLLPLRGEG